MLWKLIRENDVLWKLGNESTPDFELIRENWDKLTQVAKGELPHEALNLIPF